jgi:hypothetical protein
MLFICAIAQLPQTAALARFSTRRLRRIAGGRGGLRRRLHYLERSQFSRNRVLLEIVDRQTERSASFIIIFTFRFCRVVFFATQPGNLRPMGTVGMVNMTAHQKALASPLR